VLGRSDTVLNGRAPPYLSDYCVPAAGADTLDISAVSALEVLDDTAIYKFTYLLTTRWPIGSQFKSLHIVLEIETRSSLHRLGRTAEDDGTLQRHGREHCWKSRRD